MPDWLTKGRTAVITGGASGIGLETAKRFLRKDMNVIIADQNENALDSAQKQLLETAPHEDRLAIKHCDVTNGADIDALHTFVQMRFGPVHCLMNNAGVGKMGSTPWENKAALKQMLDINFYGAVNGCMRFIPSMLDHGESAAVINTGSKQGITKPPGNYAYNISKTALIAYTESLAHAFRESQDCKIVAHILIPGFVYTPMISKFLPQKPSFAATAEETVEFMLGALENSDFYILCPDNETPREIDEKRIQWSADDIIKNRPALSRWHKDYKAEFETFMNMQVDNPYLSPDENI